MMNRLLCTSCILSFVILIACSTSRENSTAAYTDKHRPQIHFSPQKMWMNDPNGMVYHDSVYHLFFQYYPDSTVWGPMHWGHATSKDLVRWKEQQIALYPDSLGYIFSGSTVVDSRNTSGLGSEQKVPLVSIFTHHDPEGEKAGLQTYQSQSIAYSLDNGKSWKKYSGNPVIQNPGIKDFRDPKVSWHKESAKWIMTLAVKDRIFFYSSADLKSWTKESEFGQDIGAHGGVWECPDLFSMEYLGRKIWVLLVSLNPGGPNGGSGTQYFTGNFDGHRFEPFSQQIKWIDYGPDNYAGVTWNNTGERKIFLGWMSNWQYANVVPTTKWRGAMTIPRDLAMTKIGDEYFITSAPAPELHALVKDSALFLISEKITLNGPARLKLFADTLKSFSLVLSNQEAEKVVIGYDENRYRYYIDRTKSGKTGFNDGFAAVQYAPRLSTAGNLALDVVIDNASVELFADGGVSVMTAIFFPIKELTTVEVKSDQPFSQFKYYYLEEIWER